MNSILKAGAATELKDLISYEEGSIANLDLAHTDNMKFVLMAYDEGTGLTPHRAPGNAILTALEGKAIIGYEGHIIFKYDVPELPPSGRQLSFYFFCAYDTLTL